MKATDKIDAARIDLLLGELRLPGIKLIWAALAATADRRWWSGAVVASNGIWRKRDCRRERPSTRSTSPLCP